MICQRRRDEVQKSQHVTEDEIVSMELGYEAEIVSYSDKKSDGWVLTIRSHHDNLDLSQRRIRKLAGQQYSAMQSISVVQLKIGQLGLKIYGM